MLLQQDSKLPFSESSRGREPIAGGEQLPGKPVQWDNTAIQRFLGTRGWNIHRDLEDERPCRNRERSAAPGPERSWEHQDRPEQTHGYRSSKTAMRMGREKAEVAHHVLPERAGLGFELGSAGYAPWAFPAYSIRPSQDHTDP